MNMFIVYVSIGLIVASVNMINAGCCNKGKDKGKDNGKPTVKGTGKGTDIGTDKNKDFFEKLELFKDGNTLTKIDISIKGGVNGEACGKIHHALKFDVGDITTNLSVFNAKVVDRPLASLYCYVVVVTNVIFNKQDSGIKAKMKPLCDTGCYIACIDQRDSQLVEDFNVEAFAGNPGKFKITFKKDALL